MENRFLVRKESESFLTGQVNENGGEISIEDEKEKAIEETRRMKRRMILRAHSFSAGMNSHTNMCSELSSNGSIQWINSLSNKNFQARSSANYRGASTRGKPGVIEAWEFKELTEEATKSTQHHSNKSHCLIWPEGGMNNSDTTSKRLDLLCDISLRRSDPVILPQRSFSTQLSSTSKVNISGTPINEVSVLSPISVDKSLHKRKNDTIICNSQDCDSVAAEVAAFLNIFLESGDDLDDVLSDNSVRRHVESIGGMSSTLISHHVTKTGDIDASTNNHLMISDDICESNDFGNGMIRENTKVPYLKLDPTDITEYLPSGANRSSDERSRKGMVGALFKLKQSKIREHDFNHLSDHLPDYKAIFEAREPLSSRSGMTYNWSEIGHYHVAPSVSRLEEISCMDECSRTVGFHCSENSVLIANIIFEEEGGFPPWVRTFMKGYLLIIENIFFSVSRNKCLGLKCSHVQKALEISKHSDSLLHSSKVKANFKNHCTFQQRIISTAIKLRIHLKRLSTLTIGSVRKDNVELSTSAPALQKTALYSALMAGEILAQLIIDVFT